ncbi:MAG: hypothetical protein IJ730_01800 [Alphaproteobacteria bacterium]|nr:hypothetical protein [Alphaproteobacteria bacterium]
MIKLKIEIGLGGCLKFQTLPENMRNFQNLLEIDLYKSGIKKELPEWMGDFRFLQKLLLPCGPFVDEKMPLWMFNLRNLITLDISTRGLKIIPDLISNFSKLRSLNLSGNYIEKLPAEISCLTKLEELDLSYNFFLEDLPDEMNMLVNLKFINISNTGMRKKVPDCISHVPQIKK